MLTTSVMMRPVAPRNRPSRTSWANPVTSSRTAHTSSTTFTPLTTTFEPRGALSAVCRAGWTSEVLTIAPESIASRASATRAVAASPASSQNTSLSTFCFEASMSIDSPSMSISTLIALVRPGSETKSSFSDATVLRDARDSSEVHCSQAVMSTQSRLLACCSVTEP